ncbi:MAG: hypothetical protein Q8L56_16830 [Rhodocyclaceae bacterium]|nr:hypothetical protein [Rhodocyclaceae bacterium]
MLLMPQRRVLFLDNSRLTAYRIGSGSVQLETAFGADAAGLAAFGAYLAEHRRSVFMLLADVVEESFQTEDIPHSSGKDRNAIVRRKLAQHFYGTPLSLARSQGRLKTGRRDERLLLMALTQPQHFEPWLGILRDRQAILDGIYSLPQTTLGLLPGPASKQTPPQLLLLTQTNAGLRQTYFVEGQLRFSRLTPLIRDSADTSAVAAASEAIKIHQYLATQRLIERDQPLITWLLVHPTEASAMRAHCRSNASLQFEIVDLLEAARSTGLRSPLTDSHAEMLFCHLLAKKPSSEQFAPPEEREFYRLWQIRFGLKAASAIIFAGGLLFAAHRGMDILSSRDATAEIAQQTRIAQGHYAAKMEALPKIPLGTEDLRLLIDRYDQVTKRAQGPAPLLAQLSQSLDAFPTIAIDHLEWAIAEQLAPAQSGANPAAQPPLPTAGGPYAQVTVTARLPIGMVGDHRGQLALVADFGKHLGMAPDTLVTILQPPVDTQSGKTLKSGDEKNTPEAPKFLFRLTRKL